MSEWISAETPPSMGDKYLVFLDRLRCGPDGPALAHDVAYYFTGADVWSVKHVAYWQPLPEPPLEDMIRDKLRGKQNFLVPRVE